MQNELRLRAGGRYENHNLVLRLLITTDQKLKRLAIVLHGQGEQTD